MRFDRHSHLHRCLLCLFGAAFSAAFGLAVGAAGFGEPAATYLTIAFAAIFIIAMVGILA